MSDKKSYSFVCNEEQQLALLGELERTCYQPTEVPHTQKAVKTHDCRINLYQSGKLLVQGKGAYDWILYTLEPHILKEAALGYEELNNPEHYEPHIGVDESGKGDYFGPLVIAAVYVNDSIVNEFNQLGVCDSKTIKSDKKIIHLAKEIKKIVGDRLSMVTIGPAAYNRMYAKIGNVNKILAWAHARTIENVLEVVPDCPRALADKFGPEARIKKALLERGKKIILEQRTKAESDPAVAAASIIARAGFVTAMSRMEKQYQLDIPKGCSEKVRHVAQQLIQQHNPELLSECVKCHFKTTDQVLNELGFDRSVIKNI